MKTKVYVSTNNADTTYTFDMKRDTLLELWYKSFEKYGTNIAHDVNGNMIIITPSLCSLIEIVEVEN